MKIITPLLLSFLISNYSIAQCSLTATASGTNITCNGVNDGIGAVTYSGASGSVSVLWQPSLITSTLATNLSPAIHTVTIMDANNCIATQTISIINPPALSIVSLSTTAETCYQANGSATVIASGGTGGLSYQWSGSTSYTSSVLSNVAANNYTVTIKDSNNCQLNAVTSINNINGPVINATSCSPVTCNGFSNGCAGVVAFGTSPLTYLWSYQSQTTPSVTNLPYGMHVLTITDQNNCVSTFSFIIQQPSQLVSAIASQTNVSCAGFNNGGATALANGGTPAYTYSWAPAGQTGSVLSNVGQGIYTLTVKDANNCAATSTVNITQPNPLLINTNTVINVSCFSQNDGQILTTVSGGTSPMTVSWTPNVSSSYSATNLAAGTYSLFVTDANGCNASGSYVVIQPAPLSIVNTVTTPATCNNNNGTVSVSISGGTSPYSYLWNAPGNQTTNVASNLPAGQWSYTVTDTKGCALNSFINIFSPPLPSVTVNSANPLCFGQNNGSATLTPSGAFPFSYTWSPSGQTFAIAVGLNAGVHSATVTDFYGCTTSVSATITQPNVLALSVSSVQTICNGNSVTVYGQAAGGTAPYYYTLGNFNTGIITTSNTAGGITSNETLTTTTTYTTMVTDANGCSNGPKTIVVNVTPFLQSIGSFTCIGTDSLLILSPTITSPGNGGPYFVNWSDGSSAFNDTINVNSILGTAIITYTLSDGCTIPNAVAQYTVDRCAGFEEYLNEDANLLIYPNPFRKEVTVQINELNNEAEYTIYNSLNQEVARGNMPAETTTIDLEYLNNGIYYIIVNSDGKYYRRKLVKLN